jgi:hypothetical protein
VAKRKEKEDWVMKCGKEKGKERLGDKVWQPHHQVFLFLSLCHTSSPSLPFPFSLPHFITKSSFSFLFATLHHPVFLEDMVMKYGKEKGKGRLVDKLWQRERKRKTW